MRTVTKSKFVLLPLAVTPLPYAVQALSSINIVMAALPQSFKEMF